MVILSKTDISIYIGKLNKIRKETSIIYPRYYGIKGRVQLKRDLVLTCSQVYEV